MLKRGTLSLIEAFQLRQWSKGCVMPTYRTCHRRHESIILPWIRSTMRSYLSEKLTKFWKVNFRLWGRRSNENRWIGIPRWLLKQPHQQIITNQGMETSFQSLLVQESSQEIWIAGAPIATARRREAIKHSQGSNETRPSTSRTKLWIPPTSWCCINLVLRIKSYNPIKGRIKFQSSIEMLLLTEKSPLQIWKVNWRLTELKRGKNPKGLLKSLR